MSVSTDISFDVRQAAASHCGKLMYGAWTSLTSDSIRITALGDGVALSNYLYLCELPRDLPVEGDEPRQVVLRFYGEVIKEDIVGLIQNTVLFSVLSGLKLGPRLHGLFAGGRVEEYIPSRCVTEPEMRLPNISTRVAHLLAQYHSLEMPICKRPDWFYESIEKWLPVAQETVALGSENDRHAEYLRTISDMDLETECAAVKKMAQRVDSPVVFCHNDANRGNILHLDHSEELMLIDLDYCAYNYRGFDIATYFNEWCDYQIPDKFPECLSTYPTIDQQLDFYRTYLSASGVEERDIPHRAESMVQEVKVWGTLSHFFWSLWALTTVRRCNIDFPFIEWAYCRLETYLKWKTDIS